MDESITTAITKGCITSACIIIVISIPLATAYLHDIARTINKIEIRMEMRK